MKNASSVLKELFLEILIQGVIIQVIGFFLVKDRALFSLGLWIGIICSLAMAAHMEWALVTGMDMGEGAKGHIIKHSVIRYAVVFIIFALLAYFLKYAVVPCFLGIMTLKVAAYLQPFTHKIIHKARGETKREVKM